MKRMLTLSILLIFCTLLHAQNVGIGTVNPRGKLEIAYDTYKQGPTLLLLDSGSIGHGAIIQFQNVGSLPNTMNIKGSVGTYTTGFTSYLNFLFKNTKILTVRGNGKVGINKGRPEYALDVSGNSNVDGTLRINTMSSAIKPTLLLQDSSTAVSFAPGPRIEFKNRNITAESFKIQTLLSTDFSDSYMDITFNNGYIMTLSGDKKVGINNFNPLHTLDVDGEVNITDALLINGNAGTAGQILTSTGSGAPEWKAPPGPETNPRFTARVMDWAKVNLGSKHLNISYASIYNSNPADISIDTLNNNIHIIKPGIYHFDITGNVGSALDNNINFTLWLMNLLPNYPRMVLVQKWVQYYFDSYNFNINFDVYVPAGTLPLYFLGNVFLSGGSVESGAFHFVVTGHWVSD